MSCDVFGIVGCVSLCIHCFSHSLHVYLIHIKRACIKANNLNRVSTHCNVSLEMTAPAHRAAYRGVICFIFLIYSFVIPVIIASCLPCFSPLYLSSFLSQFRCGWGWSVCSAHQSRQDSVPMVFHEYFTTLLRNLCPGIGVESSTLHPISTGSYTWSALINWVFLLLYKQEQCTQEWELISGWLLMILKTDWV